MTTTAFADLSMTVRTPDDILAAIPIVLGFVPEESVVMLTSGGRDPFHARVDLPLRSGDRRDCADELLRPVLRHAVSGVVFVFYTESPGVAASCAEDLVRTFEAERVQIISLLRSDGSRWFRVPTRAVLPESPGVPYDVSGHALTARAVASGRVTRRSRSELAATVTADHAASRAVAKARRRLADQLAPDEPAWLISSLESLVACEGRPAPPVAARLLRAIEDDTCRDELLGGLDRPAAERLVPVLSALVRAAPPDALAPVASVLAFAAWLAGDGALAWCALDRAAEGATECTLARPVAEALQRALPPSVWERR
jgi:hypothetical protein